MRLKHFNLPIASQLTKALGDEARLRILNLLLHHGPLTISDLEFILDFTQTKTSRHIAYLKNSGILTLTKIDKWALYSIKEEVEDIISQFLAFVDKDKQIQADSTIYQTLSANRELAVNKIPQPIKNF